MSDAALGALVATATAAVLLAASLRVPVSQDEAWFLHVVERCRRGEVLYRDVFYGAGPLTVSLALLAVRLARPQLLVLRAVDVAWFVCLLLAGSWLLDAVGAGSTTIVVLWLVAIALSGPSWHTDNLYGQLARLAAVVAAAAVAEWATSGAGGWLGVAGAAAGTALAAKHNLGAVVAVMAGGVVLAHDGDAVDVLVLAAGAVAVIAVALVPVIRQRALADLVARTVSNKGVYLATGGLGPLEGFRAALDARREEPPFAAVGAAVAAASFAVLPLTLAAAVIAAGVLVTGDGGDAASVPATLAIGLAAVALANVTPRADRGHVQATFPLGWVAVLLAVEAVERGPGWWPPPALAWAIAVALGVATLAALVVSLDTVHRVPLASDRFKRDVPHFRRLPVPCHTCPQTEADAADVRNRTGGRVFLLRPDAAFWYLAADLQNPTPYDYPYASVFGPHGQRATVEQLRSGEIEWVAMPGRMGGRLAPQELQQFVLDEMTAVAETPAGTLYRVG